MQPLKEIVLLLLILPSIRSATLENTLESDDSPSIQFQQFEIDLINERHRSPLFSYKAINTTIPYSYHDLPKKSSITSEHIKDKKGCKAVLEVPLLGFNPIEKVVCLHQDVLDGKLFEEGSQIGILDTVFKVEEFHSKLLPVIGFVLNDPSSVVTGYLINGSFYGTIRLYDNINMYTTHFYIEPIENAPLYSNRFLTEIIQGPTGKENAIIFEYIPHEDNRTLSEKSNDNDDTTDDLEAIIIDNDAPRTTTEGNDDLYETIVDNAVPLTSTDKGKEAPKTATEDDLNTVILENSDPLTSTSRTKVTTTGDDLDNIIVQKAISLTSTTEEDGLEKIIEGKSVPLSSTTEKGSDKLISENSISMTSTTENEFDKIILDNSVPISSTTEDEFYKIIIDNSVGKTSTSTTDNDLFKIIEENSIPITSTTEDSFYKVIVDNSIPITSTTENSFEKVIVDNSVPITSTTESLFDQLIVDNSIPLTSTTENLFDKIVVDNSIPITSTTDNEFDLLIADKSIPITSTTEDSFYKIIVDNSIPITSTTENSLEKVIVDNSVPITSTTDNVFDKIIVDNSIPITSTENNFEKIIANNSIPLTSTSTTEDSFYKIIVDNSIPITSTTEDSFYKIIVDNSIPITSTTEDSFYKIIVDNSIPITSTTEDSFHKIIVDNSIPITSTSTTEDSFYKIIVDNSIPITSTTEDSFYKIIVDNSIPITSTTEDVFDKVIVDNAVPISSTTEEAFYKMIVDNSIPITSTTENGFDHLIVENSVPKTSTTEDVFYKIIVDNSVPITTTENVDDEIIVDNSIPITSSTEDTLHKLIIDNSIPITSTTEDQLDAFIVDNSVSLTSTEDVLVQLSDYPMTSTEEVSLTKRKSKEIPKESLTSTNDDIYPLKEVWTTEEGNNATFWTSTIGVPPGLQIFSSPPTSAPNPMFPWTSPSPRGHLSHFHSTKNPHSRRNSKIHHYHSTRVPGPHRRKRKRKRPSIVSPNNGLWLTTDHPRSGHSFTSTTSSGSVAADLFSTTDAPLVGSGKHTSSSSLTGAHSWSSTSSPGASTTPGVIPPHLHSTKKVKSKSKHHFHSTRVPKPKTRRRRAASHISDFHENLISGHDDDVEPIQFNSGSAESDIFDMRREDSLICSLCIWVQPNFAAKFGFNAEMKYGLAEIMDVVRIINWLFRAIDFNEDGLPENIGFSIKRILVADDISFESIARPSTQSFNQPTPSGNSSKEKTFTSEHGYDKKIHTLESKEALDVVMNKLEVKFANCCAIFGFLYHNMAPAISTTTVRGLCTRKNIGIISGYLHAHKIGKYDLVRAMLHTLGHLFGSAHDNILQDECVDNELYSFLNPFPMHPMEQLNVALRPDSLKLSLCSKISIARYLTTDGPNCLTSKTQHFCGNGVLEDDEECDCGSMWQCQISSHCCGESGSAMQCKILRVGYRGCDMHKG